MTAFNFSIPTDDLLKVGLAIVCGGVLGMERQYKNKTAGFRTIILNLFGLDNLYYRGTTHGGGFKY